MTISKPLPDVLVKALALWDAFTPNDEKRMREMLGDSASFIEAMREAGMEAKLMYRASPETIKLRLLCEKVRMDAANFAVNRFEPVIRDIAETARREGRTKATPEELALLESLHQEHTEIRLLSELLATMAEFQHRINHPAGPCSPMGVVTKSGDVFQAPNQVQEYPCRFSRTLSQAVHLSIVNDIEGLNKLVRNLVQEMEGENPMQALTRKLLGLMEWLSTPPRRVEEEEEE